MRAHGACTAFCFLVFLAGCSKGQKAGPVAAGAETVPPGWTTLKDSVSGTSIAIPASWKQLDPSDSAQMDDLKSRREALAPGGEVELPNAGDGSSTALWAVDESSAALRDTPITTVEVSFVANSASTTLSQLETQGRAKKEDMSRRQLPAGPSVMGLKKDSSVATIHYDFLHDGRLFTVTFTCPSKRFPLDRFIFTRMIDTFAMSAPSADQPDKSATVPSPRAEQPPQGASPDQDQTASQAQSGQNDLAGAQDQGQAPPPDGSSGHGQDTGAMSTSGIAEDGGH